MLRKPSFTAAKPAGPPVWLRAFELAIEAAKVLAWPAIAAVVLIVFFVPIERIVTGLATKLEQADKVSFGSLSLEIAQKAREAGSPELAAQVGSLSPMAIEQLLLTPRAGDVILMSSTTRRQDELGLPKRARMDGLVELSRQGFIEFREDIDKFLRDLRKLPLDRTESQDSDHDWYVIPQPPGSAGFRRYREQGFKLTEKGRIASEAVIKAVTAQLSR